MRFFNLLKPGAGLRLSCIDTILEPPKLRPYWQISEEEQHDFEERQSMSPDKNDDGKTIDGNGLIKEVKP